MKESIFFSGNSPISRSREPYEKKVFSFQATLPYRGPGNLSLNGNPYVFLLFKQTGQLSVPASFANSSRSVSLKDFTQLMRDWNLSGKYCKFGNFREDFIARIALKDKFAEY